MAPVIPVEFAGQKESRKRLFSETMSKARKYSKGHASGFVPDYRHAVETMAESEGFGSSGRIDMEMTASEESCPPKRKCISLNGDGCNGYGIPKEVLPLSKMSRTERKDLIFRLRMELEQVQDLSKKLASFSSDVVMLSPYSDIRSCSDGHKRPPLENFERSQGLQVKKRAPARNNSARQRKGASVKANVPTSTSVALVMNQCETLLNRLLLHQYAWAFNVPVDVVKLNIPDYFSVIKHPMDLGTVRFRLGKGEYSSPLEFAADVRLTFTNAMTYNPPGNDFHIMAQILSKYFETRWKSIEKKIPMIEPPFVPSTGSAYLEPEPASGTLSRKRKISTSNENKVKSESARLVMTDEDKKLLSTELEALLEELPENIVDFLKEQSSGGGQTGEDEIEIDIDTLSHETLFKLRKLLDDYLVEKPKSQAKVEPCEMEIVHDSGGFSNSPAQPGKGDGPVDEDVDIVGGNDPPVSSHPPVTIEKDAAHRSSSCISSSSSSSESDSSSSDSDSASSSGSDSDTAKVSNPPAAKDKTESREHVDDNRVENLENKSLNGSSQVELNSKDKPTVLDVNGCQEGESAPSERPISPEKLYRAALLKNRFADTILKAREKALDKGMKTDPEKLRLDREELERRRKEEKERLQAEAKAAELARRKAEAEAVAEAKRKREQEREAARQALQQMEKTVEINENSKFLEDLESLRAIAQDEQVPSFMEETSPEHSQNILGSFKMPGSSNPLEQLGLYMKMDDDEEEEEEDGEQPQRTLKRENDVAGELDNDMEGEQEINAEEGKQGNNVEEGEGEIKAKEGKQGNIIEEGEQEINADATELENSMGEGEQENNTDEREQENNRNEEEQENNSDKGEQENNSDEGEQENSMDEGEQQNSMDEGEEEKNMDEGEQKINTDEGEEEKDAGWAKGENVTKAGEQGNDAKEGEPENIAKEEEEEEEKDVELEERENVAEVEEREFAQEGKQVNVEEEREID